MPQDSAGKVVFLSNHYWGSERRAGFHGLAQAFHEAGWTVRFDTTGLSRLSFLKTDPRLGRLKPADRNRWIPAPDGVETFVYCPPFHPFARFRVANPVTDLIFAQVYRRFVPESLGRRIEDSDLVVFESSAALLLFETVRRMAPRAKLAYRVSDDVRVVGMAPAILAAEDAAVGRFDLISVPSRVLLHERFGHLASARFHPHGVDLPRLAAARDGPAPDLARPACVALGTTLFDTGLLALCARARPDLRFYVVGALPAKRRLDLPNVTWCGERPFEEALAMAAHSDITAAFYRPEPGTAYLAETSNKIAQYAFFRKAVVGPRHLAGALPPENFFPVDPPSVEGARNAIGLALRADPPAATDGSLRSWPVVRDEILGDLGLPGRAFVTANNA